MQFHIDEKPLAKVENLENISRKKLSQHRTWQVIEFGESLYSGETIKTSADSDLVIRFLDSNAIVNLEADSLITIKKNDNQISLNLLEGNLFVDSTKNDTASALKLESKEGLIDITKALVNLSKGKNSELNVNLVSGQASVTLENGQSKKIETKKQGLIISEPKNLSFIETEKPEISLTWLGDLSIPQQDYIFKIGSQRSLMKVVLPLEFHKNSATLPAQFGKNFIQIEIKNKKTLERSVSAGLRVELKPILKNIDNFVSEPVVIKPAEKPKPEIAWLNQLEETQTFIKNPEIVLKWNLKNSENAKNLILTIYDKEKKIVSEKISSQATSFQAKLPRSGRYLASIEVLDQAEKKITETELKTIVSEELPYLPAAQWLDKESVGKATLNGSYQARWLALEGAENYKLLLQASDGKVIKEWAQSKTFFKLDGLLPGNYSLRLAAVDRYGRTSPNTTIKKVIVAETSEIMAPKLKKMRFK